MGNLFKRIAASVTAICAVGTISLSCLSVDAATNTVLYGDVNMDGAISILDVVSFNKYLFGMCDFTDYQNMDVNCNGLIDYIDRDLISAYITNKIGSLPYNG